jgi:hypothetical protein
MIQFNGKYFKQVISSKDYQDKNVHRVLVFNKRVIAEKNKNEEWWKFTKYAEEP